MDVASLAALVATVPDQAAVYAADLVQVQEAVPLLASEVVVAEKSATDLAIDGVAYHVFNTLRGAGDTVDGATFEDIRAIVAKETF